MRPHNPARQTRRPKWLATTTHRLSREEVASLLRAVQGEREKRVIYPASTQAFEMARCADFAVGTSTDPPSSGSRRTSARAGRSAGFRSARSSHQSLTAFAAGSALRSTCFPHSAGADPPENREKDDNRLRPSPRKRSVPSSAASRIERASVAASIRTYSVTPSPTTWSGTPGSARPSSG